ncbi:DEKNAAC100613 [Brettanomyces naardenensis]|uniref:DEKNAAC100613 n=1 Tax=Brettanomyces naardenensis TaxID=13370 RepID=A0A448YEF1_BRENA|nr:DEKNAAC100613 [Brettanomyces naardenensis]
MGSDSESAEEDGESSNSLTSDIPNPRELKQVVKTKTNDTDTETSNEVFMDAVETLPVRTSEEKGSEVGVPPAPRKLKFDIPIRQKKPKSRPRLKSSFRSSALDVKNPLPVKEEDVHIDPKNMRFQTTRTVSMNQGDAVLAAMKLKTVGARLGMNREVQKYKEKGRLRRMFRKFGKGDTIRVERMLAMVKDGDPSMQRVTDKWHEYIVVVRSTGNDAYPAVMLFYNISRFGMKDTSAVENSNWAADKMCNTRSHDLKIMLSSRTTDISFFSSFDRSFVIHHLHESGSGGLTTVVLLPHTTLSSVRWVGFLRALLLGDRPFDRSLAILLPALKVSMSFKNTAFRIASDDTPGANGSLVLKYRCDGYEVPRNRKVDQLLDEISRRLESMARLGKIPTTERATQFMQKLHHGRNFLGFAFQIYDRLEWVVGESALALTSPWALLSDGFELELREFTHDSHIIADYTTIENVSTNSSISSSRPTSLALPLVNPSSAIVEPFAVEGFLIRLTNSVGKTATPLGRGYFKLEYFYSDGHLLMFQPFYQAVPLFEDPAGDVLSSSGEVYDVRLLEKRIAGRKSLFKHCPYERDGSHVAWLKPELFATEFQARDREALYEAERRACLVANARGVIDICNIRGIEVVDASRLPTPVRPAAAMTWGIPLGESQNPEYQDSCFEMTMKDGSRLRVLACSRSIRDIWMSRLSRLCEFWTLKAHQDLLRMIQLRQMNIEHSNVCRDAGDSAVSGGENVPLRWELSNTTTDPALYTISSHSLDSPVIYSGNLYQKHAKNRPFTRVYAILTMGFFLLFNPIERHTLSERAKPTSYSRHWATIGLSGCYVYCDPRNDLDIQSHHPRFNRDYPGDHSLPRVYGDGWRSSEDQDLRYFTLWLGSSRRPVKSATAEGKVMGNKPDASTDEKGSPTGILRAAKKFGLGATHLTFLARSRVERDLWVSRIQGEIDRMA